MTNITTAAIYGDSIMKGTIFVNGKYQFTMASYLSRLQKEFSLAIRNRARFGSSIMRGAETLQKDLQSGTHDNFALLCFGGNDCNFKWPEIATDPSSLHQPTTGLSLFSSTLREMIAALQQASVQPLLMTLPPIDAHRFLSYVSRGINADAIRNWLGDVDMIYRFHEMYSNTILKLALYLDLPLIDVRSRFLDRHDYQTLISDDGMHPSPHGYELIYTTFAEYLRNSREIKAEKTCPDY